MSIKENSYHIVFYTSLPRDLRYLGALILSIVDNFSRPNALVFHLLHSGLSDFELGKLSTVTESQSGRLELHPVDDLLGSRLKEEGFGYWAWLWAVDVLGELDRVLYLDCDMLCYQDISELWEFDLGDTFGAVVPDPGTRVLSCSQKLSTVGPKFGLEYPTDGLYFNAGFFFMNLKKWRSLNLLSRLESIFHGRYNELEWHDQDALNLLIGDEVVYLDPSWNLLESVLLYETWDFELYERFGDPQRYFEPRIRHFSGDMKPDGPNARASDRVRFYHYLDQTCWAGWRGASSFSQTIKARLTDFHYLMTRGIRQKALQGAEREVLRMSFHYPYLPLLYLLLPIYRFWYSVKNDLQRRFSERD